MIKRFFGIGALLCALTISSVAFADYYECNKPQTACRFTVGKYVQQVCCNPGEVCVNDGISPSCKIPVAEYPEEFLCNKPDQKKCYSSTGLYACCVKEWPEDNVKEAQCPVRTDGKPSCAPINALRCNLLTEFPCRGFSLDNICCKKGQLCEASSDGDARAKCTSLPECNLSKNHYCIGNRSQPAKCCPQGTKCGSTEEAPKCIKTIEVEITPPVPTLPPTPAEYSSPTAAPAPVEE